MPCIFLPPHGLDPTGPVEESWWDPLQGLGPFLLPSSIPTSCFPKAQDRTLRTPHIFPFPPGQGWQTQAGTTFFFLMPLADIANQSQLSVVATLMVSAHIFSPSQPSR